MRNDPLTGEELLTIGKRAARAYYGRSKGGDRNFMDQAISDATFGAFKANSKFDDRGTMEREVWVAWKAKLELLEVQRLNGSVKSHAYKAGVREHDLADYQKQPVHFMAFYDGSDRPTEGWQPSDGSAEREFARVEARLDSVFFLQDLTDTERFVIHEHYWNGSYFKDIGKQLGVGASRAQQIAGEALCKMRNKACTE